MVTWEIYHRATQGYIYSVCWNHPSSWQNNLNKYILSYFYLNPIPTEGGRFGPEQPETGWHFHSFMTGVTKILDFVYFSICLVPVNLFLKKKLWNFEKLKNRNLPFWHQRVPPLEKKLKKWKFLFLFQIIILFLFESEF